MRILLFVCYIALLTACRNETEAPSPVSEGPKKDSKYAGILAKCKPITIDTFRVHCDENMDDTLGITANYPFKGVLLDSTETVLFPPELLKGSMGTSSGVYACYSFAIDDGHTGIIARMPSMYQSLSIKVFTLDHEQDMLTDFAELATFEGDGGEYSEKGAWLYKVNNKLTTYVWVRDSYDHSMDGEGDTTVEISNHYYVLNLSKSKYDTLSSNAPDLTKTFQAVKRK